MPMTAAETADQTADFPRKCTEWGYTAGVSALPTDPVPAIREVIRSMTGPDCELIAQLSLLSWLSREAPESRGQVFDDWVQRTRFKLEQGPGP
jgi:hypothetical protein